MRRAVVAALVAGLLFLPGCAAKRRERKEREAQFLTSSSLYQAARAEFERRNLRKARTILEKIQFTGDDRQTLEPLVRLLLADATFYLGDDLSLIEARSKYLDFVTLYGDHPLAPYAQFQAGVCSLRQAANPSRDQSDTTIAIADLRDVVRRFPESSFAPAAKEALVRAETNLAEHEFLVGRFYLQKRKYRAAGERFRGLMETYPHYEHREKLYFHMGKALLLGESVSEGKSWLDRLLADYPQSEFAKEAKSLLAENGAPAKSEERAKR